MDRNEMGKFLYFRFVCSVKLKFRGKIVYYYLNILKFNGDLFYCIL